MGDYSGICELRGRALPGKGCTAMADTPPACQLRKAVYRNPGDLTYSCTSSLLDMLELPPLFKWILAFAIWNDNATWKDEELWKDNP